MARTTLIIAGRAEQKALDYLQKHGARINVKDGLHFVEVPEDAVVEGESVSFSDGNGELTQDYVHVDCCLDVYNSWIEYIKA